MGKGRTRPEPAAAAALAALIGFLPASRAAQPVRAVLGNTVISRRDPAVAIMSIQATESVAAVRVFARSGGEIASLRRRKLAPAAHGWIKYAFVMKVDEAGGEAHRPCCKQPIGGEIALEVVE